MFYSSETSLALILKILAIIICVLSVFEHRSQILVSLSADCMYLNNSDCVFYISKLLKTSRPKSHQQPIWFKAYPYNVSLRVVGVFWLYHDKTAAPRYDINSMVFISYVPPHKPVPSKTLTGWVSDLLQKAGIHIKTFISHSLRSTSTSDVFSSGLSLTEIANVAGQM